MSRGRSVSAETAQRAIFLRFGQGLTHKQICVRLGIGRTALQDILKNYTREKGESNEDHES